MRCNEIWRVIAKLNYRWHMVSFDGFRARGDAFFYVRHNLVAKRQKTRSRGL